MTSPVSATATLTVTDVPALHELLTAPDSRWSLVEASLALPEEETGYGYDTEERATELGGLHRIGQWGVLTAVLGETARLAEPDGAFRYVRVEPMDAATPWTQATPLGLDAFRVELNTEDGWVEEFCRADGAAWTLDQAAAVMRLWVTRRFRRADGVAETIPPHA